MKMLPSLIISVALVLAVGLSRSRDRVNQASAMAHDLRDAEPLRESEAGKVLAQACGNCHSNHTEWPWYSHVAPLSWWIQSHVRANHSTPPPPDDENTGECRRGPAVRVKSMLASGLLSQVGSRERQLTNALARCRVDGIAESRNKRRNPRLTDTSWRRITFN
jgi:hypothetical protein